MALAMFYHEKGNMTSSVGLGLEALLVYTCPSRSWKVLQTAATLFLEAPIPPK